MSILFRKILDYGTLLLILKYQLFPNSRSKVVSHFYKILSYYNLVQWNLSLSNCQQEGVEPTVEHGQTRNSMYKTRPGIVHAL